MIRVFYKGRYIGNIVSAMRLYAQKIILYVVRHADVTLGMLIIACHAVSGEEGSETAVITYILGHVHIIQAQTYVLNFGQGSSKHAPSYFTCYCWNLANALVLPSDLGARVGKRAHEWSGIVTCRDFPQQTPSQTCAHTCSCSCSGISYRSTCKQHFEYAQMNLQRHRWRETPYNGPFGNRSAAVLFKVPSMETINRPQRALI